MISLSLEVHKYFQNSSQGYGADTLSNIFLTIDSRKLWSTKSWMVMKKSTYDVNIIFKKPIWQELIIEAALNAFASEVDWFFFCLETKLMNAN